MKKILLTLLFCLLLINACNNNYEIEETTIQTDNIEYTHQNITDIPQNIFSNKTEEQRNKQIKIK